MNDYQLAVKGLLRVFLTACCLILVTVGCSQEDYLPAPDMPFDTDITHLPEAIAPGGNVIFLTAGENIEFEAQEALIGAQPGTTLVFPAGTHKFSGELISNTSHITIAGMGMSETILDFSEQESGAQGILSLGDYFTIQDLAVLDPAGDGIRAEGSTGVIIRRVHVEWTNGPDPANGAYGLYPILSSDVLVEDCIVKGSSDAGVYVGQSQNIIVRRNVVEYNVAGIEIENSVGADVYDNWVAYNTGGVLVFSLPNLIVANGRDTRVFDNVIFNNATFNFAPPGNIVTIVPAGTGILIMANDNIEVFGNQIRNNQTVSIAVVSFLIAEEPYNDDRYDPIPETIYLHDNLLERPDRGFNDGSEMNLLVRALYGFFNPQAEMLYDGIGETFGGGTELPADKKLCLANNTTHKSTAARFGNMHLENPGNLFIPGGPITEDKTPHLCAHTPLAAITIPAFPPVPPPADEYTPEEVATLCGTVTAGVNWGAAVVDCPNIADYNLWPTATDPLSGENSGGLPFDLTTPLFSDYAYKYRQVYIPSGEQVAYSEDDFVYPVGTIITKTFYYPDNFVTPTTNQLIETRLLIRRDSGWQRLGYIWNGNQATLAVGGGSVDVNWIHYDGQPRSTTYQVPNQNQCSSCHGAANTDKPLGPKALRLNTAYAYGTGSQNQLVKWAADGILQGLPGDLNTVPYAPEWNKPSTGSTEERARAYLETNCAHCHSSEGRAASTGLLLMADATLDVNAGICKPPIAAGPGTGGLLYDIVPGNADDSIMVLRMDSAAPEIKMPELAKSLVHTEGVALVSEWINELSGGCANSP